MSDVNDQANIPSQSPGLRLSTNHKAASPFIRTRFDPKVDQTLDSALRGGVDKMLALDVADAVFAMFIKNVTPLSLSTPRTCHKLPPLSLLS